MDKNQLISVLAPWNLWGNKIDTGIKREEYIKEARECLKTNSVLALIGIRRSGKSYITKQIASTLTKKKEDSLIVNFEEVKLQEPATKDLLVKIYEAYLEIVKPTSKPLIILDEVQNVKGWEKFVRTLHERKEAKIVVTGSSAKLMSEELATLLTGRILSINVFPLSFREFLIFKGIKIHTELDVLRNERKIKTLLHEYLEFGGFPEVVLTERKDIKTKLLQTYYDDILVKDIVKRYDIRKPGKLEIIGNFYINNFSSRITFNSIARFTKLNENIVERYTKYLENAKLLFLLKAFSPSIKEEESNPKKAYIMDIGFKNVMNLSLSDRITAGYENVVAVHLLKRHGKNLFYWKDYHNREVDFVIKKGNKIEYLIQVCYNINDETTRKRELRSLLHASKNLRCKNLLVITDNYDGEEEVEWWGLKRKVRFVQLWRWLLTHENG